MELYALIDRARDEFIDMPGLQLTPQQAARLWGLEPAACQAVIEALVESRFLRRTFKGTIMRADRSAGPALPPVWC